MRHTRFADLAVPFLVLGITVYVLLRFAWGSLPELHYAVAAPLGALAVGELVAARRVRAAVRHDPHARPMAAIVIARCVALGKASSLVAAAVAGVAGALLVRVVPEAGTVRAAANDARVGVVCLGVALLLVAAGLVLERAGLDPGRHDDGRPGAGSGA